MSVENNITIMRRWFKEVWLEGKTQIVTDVLAPRAVCMGQLEDGLALVGPDEFIQFVERTRRTFPDMKISIEDIFGVDDRVVIRWSGVMTHQGDDLGIPASQKRVKIGGISIARFENGMIVEGWDNWDQLGMLKQIGVYGSPRHAMLKTA